MGRWPRLVVTGVEEGIAGREEGLSRVAMQGVKRTCLNMDT